MIGNLTFDKANMNLSYFLYTLILIDKNGGKISRKDFVEGMSQFINVSSEKNGKENRTPFNKSKLPRYFGFVSLFNQDDVQYLCLTNRGYYLLPYIDSNTDCDPKNMYYVTDLGRNVFAQLVLESVIFDSFGRNNCGAEQSDTDIEPPKLIFRMLHDIKKATIEQICYVIFGLNNGFFTSYKDAISSVETFSKTLPGEFKNKLVKWKKWNITKDCKIVNIFTDNNINLIRCERDASTNLSYYSLNNEICDMYEAQISTLPVYYCPLRLNVFGHSGVDSWIRYSILGSVYDESLVLFENDTSKLFGVYNSDNYLPGTFEKCVAKAYNNLKNNIYLIIDCTNTDDIYLDDVELLKYFDDFTDDKHGWSQHDISDVAFRQYLDENVVNKSLLKDGYYVPYNINVIKVSAMKDNQSVDYVFNNIYIENSLDEQKKSSSIADSFRKLLENYLYVDDEAESYRQSFLKKYSVEIIEHLNQEQLLNYIFLNSDNKENLCYELEFSPKSKMYFGGIGGGTAAKYDLFFSPKHNSWIKGRNTKLSEEDAYKYAKSIVDYLIAGAKYILDIGLDIDEIDNNELEGILNKKTNGYFDRVWFKKYYAILRPDIFPPVFSISAQNSLLNSFSIKPDKNSCLRFSQIRALAKSFEVSSVCFCFAYWDNVDLFNSEDDELLFDNEIAFKEWLLGQKDIYGNKLSTSYVSSVMSALNNVSEKVNLIDFPDFSSFFEISSLDIFVQLRDAIIFSDSYDFANEYFGKGILSKSLRWYELFLNEMHDPIDNIQSSTNVNEYTKEDFLNDVFITTEKYEKLVRLLTNKKNVILYGAPGVGKTFLAKRLVYSMLGNTDESKIEMIQFHENYSYEDFIMGYRPVDSGFQLKTGVFYKFCKTAENNPESNYYFIIDEINRGKLSKIFGELLMLIESDKRGLEHNIKLAYNEEWFSVPNNVYIIGMMNTADRGLAIIDYALRRRFSFFEVEPAFASPKFKKYLKNKINDEKIIDCVISNFNDLNCKISDIDNSGLGKGFCIGHSYFCSSPSSGQSDEDWYKSIIDYEIVPLLEEYWWDDKEKSEDCKKDLLNY